MKAAHIHARIDPEIKSQAEAVLAELGLTPSQTMNLLYRQIIAHRGVPFPVRIPNDDTIAVMNATDAGQDVFRFASTDAMFAALKAD